MTSAAASSAKTLVALLLMVGAALGVTPASASSNGLVTQKARAYFVLGQQLVPEQTEGTSARAAIARLLAGPSANGVNRGLRTFVPSRTHLLGLSVAGGVATVNLNAPFQVGSRAEGIPARIAQLVYSATSVSGVTRVRLLIEGESPKSAMSPQFDLSKPIGRADVARPKFALPQSPAPKTRPAVIAVRKYQQQLADLGFLPSSAVDGRAGAQTGFSVTAFQKWADLPRDGVAGPATLAALSRASRPTPATPGSGKRVEVLLDKQLALLVSGGRVIRVITVSTGKGVNATPPGSFAVFRKEERSWSYPFQVWLPWASYFVGGIAFHEYPDVPTSAASHGCVRVPRYDSRQLYSFATIGTTIRVVSSS